MADVAMEQAWTRVTAWMARYAPGSFRTLNPPATARDLEQARSRLQVDLPQELLTLLSMTDGCPFSLDPEHQFGSRFLPGGFTLTPVAQIPDRTEVRDEIIATAGEEMLGWWWHPHWVPFAEHVAADALVIDERPQPGQGRVGEFRHDDHTEFDLAASLTAYITSLADALEQQHDFLCFRPLIVEGRLDWDVVTSA